jgi:hypothetical protein
MSELVASLSVEEQFNRVSSSNRGQAQQQAPHYHSSAPSTRLVLLLLLLLPAGGALHRAAPAPVGQAATRPHQCLDQEAKG